MSHSRDPESPRARPAGSHGLKKAGVALPDRSPGAVEAGVGGVSASSTLDGRNRTGSGARRRSRSGKGERSERPRGA
jgi:hypothetical protein